MPNFSLKDLSFPLSPVDAENLHRIWGIDIDKALSARTENTGGNVMNDLYFLPGGNVVCVHAYGVNVYRSFSDWESSSETPFRVLDWWEWEPTNRAPHYISQEDFHTMESLIEIWEDNCEMIFPEKGSADELLAQYGDTIPVEWREWVERFIVSWDRVVGAEE